MNEVIIIGGGPAGMIAALMAAKNHHKVILIEKNEKLGKKLYITGKGRCNLTNACDVEDLLKNVLSNNKFLYSAFYTFDSYMLMDFFDQLGLNLKIERGNRVFPKSDKSSDVIKVLKKELVKQNVVIHLEEEVKEIGIKNNSVQYVKTKNETYKTNHIIVATGGLSYSVTGSTGDGYIFAKSAGHKVTKTSPGLVPIETKEQWVKDLQGLSLKNVNIKFIQNNKVLYDNFGEMLFTHFGLSGPLILSGSSHLPKESVKDIVIHIDLKPSLTIEQLDARIVRDFNKYTRKNYSNALGDLLPKKLIPIIVQLSGISENKRVDQITKKERLKLVSILKGLQCTILKTRSYKEAIITRGGIHLKEVNPNTMESKLVKGLYFAGEVLDLDALTGGFNLQIAFSTGHLAGISI